MNAQPPIDFNTRVAQYVKLRDKIKAIKEEQTAALAPYTQAFEQLNGILLNHLNQTNQDAAKSKSGTVYRTLKKSASIADKEAFWAWVVQHKDVRDYIDLKANATAVEEHVNHSGNPPPGVNWSTRYEVGVRRGSGGK